jgi:hypothetical protein
VIIPNVLECEDGIKPVADALSEHKHRLQTLHVRSVSVPLVGSFLHAALLTGTRRVPALEELDIGLHGEYPIGIMGRSGELEKIRRSTLPNTVFRDIGDAFPALKTLALPGYSNFIPAPSTSTLLTNLVNLRLNGMGGQELSPLYEILRFLHHTPNLKSLWYKASDQFSYWDCPHEGKWSYNDKEAPVTLPVPLPHLRVAEVSASGSGTHVLHCVVAPKLQDVHFDASRVHGQLEDWHDGLANDVTQALEELSRRSPEIRRLAFTEMPQRERVFSWILTGEGSGGDPQLGNAKGDVPFNGLEELIVKDGELSAGSVEELEQTSPVQTLGLTDTVLGRYIFLPRRVSLKKLGIHRTQNLSGENILAAAKKAMDALAKTGTSEPFTIEFMENQGPGEIYVKQLEALGVKVTWVREVSGPDTDRDGWWTPDFTAQDASF